MRGAFIVVSLVILSALPVVAAQTTADLIWERGEEGELNTWIIYSDNFENGDEVSFSDNATWFKFHPYDKAIDQSIMYISIWVSVTIQSTDDGTWNYTFEAELGDSFEGCSKSIVTRDPGVLGGSPVAYYSFPIRCDVLVTSAIEDQTFTWWINRTLSAGSPDVPLAQQFTVRLDRGDFIVTDQPSNFEIFTGLNALEFGFLIALPLVGILLWRNKRDPVIPIFGVLLVLITVALLIGIVWTSRGDAWPFLISYAIILLGLCTYQAALLVLDAVRGFQSGRGGRR